MLQRLIILLCFLGLASGMVAQGIPEVPLDSRGKSLAKRGFRKAWPYVRHAVTWKNAWQIGVSMQGYASKNFGRRLFRDVVSADFAAVSYPDSWALGGGLDVFFRYNFPALNSQTEFFLESAIQLSYIRGRAQVGKRIVDGVSKDVITGYDTNMTIGVPLMMGMNTNIKNVPVTFLVGWERYYLPDNLNGHINYRTERKGANLLFESGIQFPRIPFIEAFTLQYKVRNQFDWGRKNFIGLRLRMSILRS